MRQILKVLLTLVLVVVCYGSQLAAQDNATFVFTHVNVIPMNTDTILYDRNVVVTEGIVREIGSPSSAKLPKGATIVDARGKFLIPALSDMHVHLEGDAWNIMFPSGSKFSKQEIDFTDISFVYIANGITTVDVMSALPEHIELREAIKKNKIIGPRLILSRMIDAADRAWPPPICTWIHNPQEARDAVNEMHAQGYDRVKVYSFLDKDSYDAIISTAKQLKMPIDGHVPYATSVEYVLSSGQSMIAHTEEILKFAKAKNPEEVDKFASLLAKSNTWVTTTLILNRNLNAMLATPERDALSKPGVEYLHPMGIGIWNFLYQNRYKRISDEDRRELVEGYQSFQKPFTYALFKKGGKLLVGTDSPIPTTLPGISVHEELEELVSLGLTPYEALRISTTNTYEFLNELDSAGSVEPGKKANLVLLDKNPLEKISNTKTILGVMTQNRWISKGEIDKRLKEISGAYSHLEDKKQAHDGNQLVQ